MREFFICCLCIRQRRARTCSWIIWRVKQTNKLWTFAFCGCVCSQRPSVAKAFWIFHVDFPMKNWWKISRRHAKKFSEASESILGIFLLFSLEFVAFWLETKSKRTSQIVTTNDVYVFRGKTVEECEQTSASEKKFVFTLIRGIFRAQVAVTSKRRCLQSRYR